MLERWPFKIIAIKRQDYVILSIRKFRHPGRAIKRFKNVHDAWTFGINAENKTRGKRMPVVLSYGTGCNLHPRKWFYTGVFDETGIVRELRISQYYPATRETVLSIHNTRELAMGAFIRSNLQIGLPGTSSRRRKS